MGSSFDGRAKIGRRWGVVFGGGYLVFLAAPVVEEVISRRSPWTLAAVAVALAVFAVVYLSFWATASYGPIPTWRSIGMVAALVAISIGLTLHNAAWIWCLIYCAVAAGASSWKRRLSAGLVIAVAAVALALGAVDRAAADSLAYLVPVILLGGLGMLGWGRIIETNHQLHQAREEVGRLAVAEERLRFARDLHDLLGHSLSVIVLKSELAGRLSASAPERAAQEIRDVERVAREALREVREAVAGYRQPGLSQELASARGILRAAGIDMGLRDLSGALPTAVDATLAWALREGVTNVIRHSRAGRVEISLVDSDGSVELELIDDGAGCEDCGPGNGLRGLRERVAVRCGTLTAGPRPEGGFRLAVSLPLQDAPRPATGAPA